MASLVSCPSCSGLVRPNSRTCPHCDIVFRPIQAAAMRVAAAAAAGFAMLTLAACYGRMIGGRSLCAELPDGGVETPDATGCFPCTGDVDCVNGVYVTASCWHLPDGGIGQNYGGGPLCVSCTNVDAGSDAGEFPAEAVCVNGAYEIETPDAGTDAG